MSFQEQRDQTAGRRIGPIRTGHGDPLMDWALERILQAIDRQATELDTYHYCIATGYWIPEV